MFRVSLANVTAHRTCAPLYEQHQATPYPIFLDAAETGDVYSGMVLARSGEDKVVLYDGASATQRKFGLSALDRNTVIDDTQGLDNVPVSVWLGGEDAFFTIDAPAFDTAASAGWTVATDGSRVALYAGTSTAKGKLTSDVNGEAVAELIQVVSTTRIIIRLLPTGVDARTALA